MKFFTKIIVLLFINSLLASTALSASTPNYWQCYSRKGGTWGTFGTVPSTCLVDHMQSQESVKGQYSPLIFRDSQSSTTERRRYMTELNAVVEDVATYYLKRRKPGVSQAEIDGFTYGMKALLHQETGWTHYRQATDNKVRYMRGDYGHGHGIMQVDDRSHLLALKQGKGVDLIENMIYGLDVFYAAWAKAPSSGCSSSTNYTTRTRSAWSAYNGGSRRICRWTNLRDRYAEHDKQFYSKYRKASWNSYITDSRKPSSLDITCMVEGTRPCLPGSSSNVDTAEYNKLYQNSRGDYCVLKSSNRLDCVRSLNDVNCLQAREKQSYSGSSKLSKAAESKYSFINLDRHGLCKSNITGLYSLGNTIEINKNINLRRNPGGARLTTLKAGNSYDVLDFQVTSTSDQKRYYKVKSGSHIGYLYAGDANDYDEWAELVHAGNPNGLAENGDHVEVVAPYGINLRNSPAGSLVERIQKNEIVKVSDVVIQGDKKYVYYKITSEDGLVGYIYTGNLSEPSIDQWTQLAEENISTYAVLKQSLWYRFLKSCDSGSCDYIEHYVKGPGFNSTCQNQDCSLKGEKFKIIRKSNGFYLIKTSMGIEGWISREDIIRL